MLLPILLRGIRKAEQIVGGNAEIPREGHNMAAGDLLRIVFVFADLLLGGVQKLGDLLLCCFSFPRFLQPAADVHETTPFFRQYPQNYYTPQKEY